MITQEDIFGVNIGEPWAPGEVEEEVLRGNEKGFITSPADIDPREPIKLRDAEVTPEHRKAFQNLCSEFEVIFSRDSADLGKTLLNVGSIRIYILMTGYTQCRTNERCTYVHLKNLF